MSLPPVGILSTGTYIPRPRMTSTEIAEASGVPRRVIEETFGILEKPIPGPHDHPATMGAKAAKVALRRAKISPLDLDLLSIDHQSNELTKLAPLNVRPCRKVLSHL